MLTKNKIIQFSRMLEDMLILTKDMTKTRSYENLFNSENDLNDSRLASILIPDDYYNFRCFDVTINIRFKNRTKYYYIHIESLDYNLFRSFDFKNTFELYFKDMHDIHFDDSGLNYFIKKEISFTSVIDIYKKIILFYLSKTILKDVLFEVY